MTSETSPTTPTSDVASPAVTNRRAAAVFLAGAVTVPVAVLAAIFAWVYLAFATQSDQWLPHWGDINSTWVTTMLVAYIGIVAALVGAYFVERTLRPSRRPHRIALVLLSVGSVLTFVLGNVATSRMDNCVVTSTDSFDLDAWNAVRPAEHLSTVVGGLAFVAMMGALVWWIVIAIRAGAQRVASTQVDA